MIQDIQNFNRMIAGMNFTNKEMVKFLALYQAIKTIDNMSEQEDEMDKEEENGEDNGEAMIILPVMSELMKKKKKVASKSSYGSFRKLGTRK
jgi:hypothetical protein